MKPASSNPILDTLLLLLLVLESTHRDDYAQEYNQQCTTREEETDELSGMGGFVTKVALLDICCGGVLW
jgi:hypothetical protein